jgi:uncharacterized membrane protein YccC
MTNFWLDHLDFYLSQVIAIVGVWFSIKAFREAREAKKAANAAGRTVKCLTVAIELTELLPKLGTPSDNIPFDEARNLLSDTTQRLHRILSSFENDPQVKERIAKLWTLLDETRQALDLVRPKSEKGEAEVPQAVYNAIESYFARINDLVSDLVGLFEQKTSKFGDDNGT